MKIIDRYVLGMFVKNYVVSFMVLIGMYIAIDMVFNFGNFTQSNGMTANVSTTKLIYDIANFYFYQSFFFFVQLAGMIAVVAAGFTMLRLMRYNELTAMLAAGMPLLRVAVSVIAAGVALNLILLPLDQELIIPTMIPQLVREHQDIHEARVRTFPVRMMQDKYNGLFNAALYSPPTRNDPAHVDYLDVIERNQNLEPTAHLYARSATWNARDQRWDLVDGQSVPIAPTNQPADAAAKVEPVRTYQSDITPDEIALNLGKDYIQLLPISKMNQLLQRHRYGVLDLLRTRNNRITQPLINVILLLLAIATILTREPGTFKQSAAKCMALTGLCMGAVFLTYQMAGSPPNPSVITFWSALMAWIPIFIFGPIAIHLLGRIKT